MGQIMYIAGHCQICPQKRYKSRDLSLHLDVGSEVDTYSKYNIWKTWNVTTFPVRKLEWEIFSCAVYQSDHDGLYVF